MVHSGQLAIYTEDHSNSYYLYISTYQPFVSGSHRHTESAPCHMWQWGVCQYSHLLQSLYLSN